MTKISGCLITIEGIDGCGKSTLSRALENELKKAGHSVLLTREPGATALGKEVRALVQSTHGTTSLAEFFLFAADRAQHVAHVVKPALEKGMIVISDRMADSSRAYQGYGRGLDLARIDMVNNWAMDGLVPDLTLYVAVPVEVASSRIAARNEATTVFEQEKQDFFQRIAQGFEATFAQRSSVARLDGCQDKQVILEQALKAIETFLESCDER